MSSQSQTLPRRASKALIRLEKHQGFILALIIVLAYVFFYGYILFTDKSGALDGIEKVSSTFGTVVAVVVGYYFGQRPVQEVSGQRDLYRRELMDLYNQIEPGKKQYEELKKYFENIKKELGGE